MKVLITEIIWDEGIEELEINGVDVHYDQHLWKNRDQLLTILKDYDALIVRNQTKVDQEVLTAAPNLKVIGRLGVGLDNIDVKKAKEKGIKIVYARNANATSVAEYVMTAILSAQRPIILANEDVRNGHWNRQKYTGKEVSQKTLGLIGLGEISHRVAKRAVAFGINVVGFDPFITDYDHIVTESGVKKLNSLNEVLNCSDFVSIHIPLTPETMHLISKPELSMMRSNSILINTSRGGIVDEHALSVAIKNRTIAGAVLDVLETEPVDSFNPLLSFPNVILTPHIAGLTDESQIRTSLMVAKEVTKLLNGNVSLNVV